MEESKANPLPNLLCQQNEDGKPGRTAIRSEVSSL